MKKGKKVEVPKTRDYLMVAVINGATKAAVFKDRKKAKNKNACRGKVRGDE